MAWKKFKREDRFQGSNRPFVSISYAHIGFNAMFVRQANISSSKRVSIYVDSDDMKIGFEFHDEERVDSFALTRASGNKKGTKRQGLNCAASGFVAKYKWVNSITRFPVKDRRFFPRKEGSRWVVQLRPSFENRHARESHDIPSDIAGIYRYLRVNGEVVYIGKGEIRKRLSSPERKDWDFDIIEYSAISDPDRRLEWEDYWINRFKEDHQGKLPFYNRQSGHSGKPRKRKRSG
jgi:hypothetical protein